MAKKEIRKVKLKKGTGKILMEKFGCSPQAVSAAVNGIYNSELCKKIRKEAVKLGGDPIY